MKVLFAVLWKDLVCEWRSRDRIVAMGVFALLVVVIFHFALPSGTGSQIADNAPGLLWVAFVFSALLGLGRSFAQEVENDAISALALAPTERGFVFLGKALANFLLIGAVQAMTATAFALVFDLSLSEVALPLAAVTALGTLGIASVGTLIAAMAVRTRYGEVLMPILLLPTLVPILVGAVEGTQGVLSDGALPLAAVQLLVVVDVTYLIVSFLGFEYVLDE
ncbi:MAG: heme exporter protein CcmB [Myxococcota bacterium]